MPGAPHIGHGRPAAFGSTSPVIRPQGEWRVSGRVSDAGWVRGVDPVIGPASESLRRRNPRESGDGLPVYGDLAGRRLCRGMILARSLRAESRLRLWIDRY